MPIEGRIVSLEGRPIAGLTVKLDFIAEFARRAIKKLRENGRQDRRTLVRFETGNVFEPGEGDPIRPLGPIPTADSA